MSSPMQIGVRGTFSFSEIFGGKLNLTTTCNLAISQPYSLIYAEMTNLDVIAVLNEAFGLGLAGQSLIVTSAGFFTFSTSGGGSSQATLQSIFPDSPVPATVSSTATPVTDTSSFWLTVQLTDTDGDDSNDGLFISLVDIGVSSGTQLSLSATFASGAVAGTAIKSADYALSLDGEVELFGIFTFQDVVINYSIADSTLLSVSGTLDIALFGSNFTFTGTVSSDSGTQLVTADVLAQGNVNLDSLFGGAFTGISFTNIAFNLNYPYGSNTDAAQFMVRGGCDFDGLEFTGLLYMEGLTPVLGSVVFTQQASIGALFEQCIPGASWPDTLVDLTLLSGCQVYYNSTAEPLTLTLSNDGTAPTLLPVPPAPASPTQVPPARRSSPIRQGSTSPLPSS
jgi:hypothetical protein